MLQRRLYKRLDAFLSEDWSIIAFQPVLYFFLWGASVRLAGNTAEPLRFTEVISPGTYAVWVITGLLCPPLALLAWFLIKKQSGAWRYRGFWFRLAADVGMFVCILTYHIVLVMTLPHSETRLYSRYTLGAALVFVLLLVVRDIWAIRNIEHLARKIK